MAESIYRRIYAEVRRVPRGRVATYGQIAALAGFPRHARQVGYALHGLRESEDGVPWHRIVNSKGEPFKKRFTFLDFFNSDGSASQNAEENSFVIKDLPPETYTITLKLPGYKNAVQTFTVVAGETAEASVEFEAE